VASATTATSLQALFPNLVTVFSRWTDERSRDILGTLIRAESQAIIYQPIRPSTLVQASILGDTYQITKWGGNIVMLSTTHAAEGYTVADDGCTCVTPKTCFFDDIIGIRFLENGRLLPEKSDVVVEFPLAETALQTELTVDFDVTHTWNEQEAEDTAKGIFSLIPTLRYPEAKRSPKVNFIGVTHDRIPLAAILNQVGESMYRTFVSTDSFCIHRCQALDRMPIDITFSTCIKQPESFEPVIDLLQ
jgi:hypothetical protein